mgnify:FL=1
MRFLCERRALIAAARRMNAVGLNHGTAGNLSVRVDGGFLITPGSIDYDTLEPEDLFRFDGSGQLAGDRSAPGRRPSSEWRLHADVLRQRPDVGAVLHCHSPRATALACHERGIPGFHYMVVVAGGDRIDCAPYHGFGTRALSDATCAALAGRRACLLAHHGQVALGADPGQALALAVEVETLAWMYLEALRLGEPPVLAAEELERVRQRMRALAYGGWTENGTEGQGA